ncbi:hypothetical protein D9M73_109580 [compost metagenome]
MTPSIADTVRPAAGLKNPAELTDCGWLASTPSADTLASVTAPPAETLTTASARRMRANCGGSVWLNGGL